MQRGGSLGILFNHRASFAPTSKDERAKKKSPVTARGKE